MKIDYGTLLSSAPIYFNFGTIRKPTLKEIADPMTMGYVKFSFYESFLDMTPKQYYSITNGVGSASYWDGLSDKEKENMSMYAAISNDVELRKIYLSLFQFFFIEPVTYVSGSFVILKQGKTLKDNPEESIKGVILEDDFLALITILKQLCCLQIEQDESEEMVFKNDKARRLYEKMQKAKQEESERRKNDRDKNYSIPNVISAVVSRHPSLNYINVWELTLCQLMDVFERLRIDEFYWINRMMVSVWGDEKKQFDAEAWYRNIYEKN